MKMTNYTKQERALVLMARIWAVLFFLTAIGFAIAPFILLNYISDVGRAFFGWSAGSASISGEPFWAIPMVSLNVALSYLCLMVQKDPVQYTEYLRLIIIAMFVATVGFIISMLGFQTKFLYLVGALGAGAILLITFLVYRSAMSSRNRWI